MVVSAVAAPGAASAAPTPARPRAALVVPDEAAWLTWGRDLPAAGIRRVAAPERAELLVAPALLPPALAPAVREAWQRMPPDRRLAPLDAPTSGLPLAAAVGEDAGGRHDAGGGGHDAGGGHGAAGGHGGHAGHDMMAIVGEPSADGLVMEAIDLVLGPLAPSLPGGLAVDLSLDGDVVAQAVVRATLAVPAEALSRGAAPDPLAAGAWQAARAARQADGARAPAAARRHAAHAARGGDRADGAETLAWVERERALSHAAWLRMLAVALGWAQLADAALALARALLALPAPPPPAHRPAAPPAAHRPAPPPAAGGRWDALAEAVAGAAEPLAVVAGLAGSRRLRRRLAGEGAVAAAALRHAGIGGPVARAAGIATDARADDPRYDRLGFAPQLADGSDALARTRLRLAEIGQSLRLLAALAADPAPIAALAPAARVEGPRGPLDGGAGDDPPAAARRDPAAALRRLAGEATRGRELAAATVVLVSFDLSPWATPARQTAHAGEPAR